MHPDDHPSAFVSSGAFCWKSEAIAFLGEMGNGEFPLRLIARSQEG